LAGAEHSTPQAPQLVTVVVLVSQPLEATASQLPKPVLHVPRTHAPDAQEALALAKVQTFPQVPQLLALVLVLVSQPLEATASQLPKPALHAPRAHAPDAQEALALAKVQTFPQAPQLVALVLVLVSQPLEATASQLPKPALHMIPQTLMAQVGVPLVPLHAAPQAPQWAGVPVRSVSQPSVATALQLPHPPAQVKPQALAVQVATACAGGEHATPQAPQLDTSVARLTQDPAQYVVGAAQMDAQDPAEHTVPAAQDRPQTPQLPLLVWRFTSQPLEATPSQLP
jgi:hypothetical protein